MNHRTEARVLVGPTAAGKSAVAHLIALNCRQPLLSADSMLIYRDMDIGTAKPEPEERQEVDYYGIDIVTPADRYSTGDYYHYVQRQKFNQPVVVAGGTGLYVKTLLYGMDDVPPAHPELRTEAEGILATGGLAALQEHAKQVSREGYDLLKDPDNPRRIIRMLERHAAGMSLLNKWTQAEPQTVVGLNWDRDDLKKRILWRIDLMYNDGLLDEADRIRKTYPELSDTAQQAIGYREAFAVLDGEMTEKEAREKTATRTRQFAKRQMTWFRNQLTVHWIDVSMKDRIEDIAGRVEEAWESNGHSRLAV